MPIYRLPIVSKGEKGGLQLAIKLVAAGGGREREVEGAETGRNPVRRGDASVE